MLYFILPLFLTVIKCFFFSETFFDCKSRTRCIYRGKKCGFAYPMGGILYHNFTLKTEKYNIFFLSILTDYYLLLDIEDD